MKILIGIYFLITFLYGLIVGLGYKKNVGFIRLFQILMLAVISPFIIPYWLFKKLWR